MNDDQPSQTVDHDLIVQIKTTLDIFRDEQKIITNDTKERLILLGANKLEKDAFNDFLKGDNEFKKDHERRVRKLESWGLVAIGGLYVLEAIIGIYIALHH